MQQQVDFRLSVEELNLVLVALSQLPYAQVHELIARLQADIAPQLVAAATVNASTRAEATRSG